MSKPKVRQPAPLGLPVAVTATWYCLAGVSRCTRGYDDQGLYAAISPDLLYLKGKAVTVCVDGQDPGDRRCVVVTVVDCDCATTRGIDLYAAAFEHLAPLSTGRIRVILFP